jgi:hypothetical protein
MKLLYGTFLLPFLWIFAFGELKVSAMENPPAPFAAKEAAVKAIPELRAISIMKRNSTRGEMDGQYAFVCGDKMLCVNPNEKEGDRIAKFKCESNGQPLFSISYWGRTKAGYGFPFNNSVPEAKLDKADKSITVTRKFESLAKDDSTFIEKARLLDDGLIELDYSCSLPEGGKITDRGLFVNLSPYDRIAGTKMMLGDKELSFSPDDAEAGVKTLFEGAFSGRIVLFAGHPEKAIALEIPDRRKICIKELRNAEDKDKPYRYMGQMRITPDSEGSLELRLDMRNSSPEDIKTADTFAGINFWKHDRLHIPDFSASKNLLRNPSFEDGLHYYKEFQTWGDWPGEDRNVYSIDESVAFSGKRSLKVKTWKDCQQPAFLSTFTIPTTAGRKYTFSFQAKADFPKTLVNLRCVTGEWLKFPRMPSFALTPEWNRYSCTFTAPNNAAIVMLRVVNDHAENATAWFDDLQLEEGEAATSYADARLSVDVLTSASGNVLKPGTAGNARIRIHAAANEKGSANWEIEDFFYGKPASGSFDFVTDATGEANVAIPLDGHLGKGVFILKTEVRLNAGSKDTEFHRLSVMDAAPVKCRNKSVFGTEFSLTSKTESNVARLAFLGFGSTNYINHPVVMPLLEKYNMPDLGTGIAAYGPGKYTDCKVAGRQKLEDRLPNEPCNDALLSETEKISYEMAQAYPSIRTWFLQAESNARKFKCERDGDYEGFAKLIFACRAGVLKADRSLGFIFEGGPTNMYPGNGIKSYDQWLTAAEKLHPEIRFDKFAIHPYRPVPESPDLDADADLYLRMLARHGYQTEPVYWNEGVYNCPWHIPEWGLDVHRGCSTDHWRCGTPSYHMGWAERVSAAYSARSWLVALKYSDRVKQLTDYNFNLFFDIEGAYYATAKIPNTLCHLLGDARFKRDIRFAMNCRAYVFEQGQGRPVAAIWSCIPDVDHGLEQSPVAKLRIQGETPEFIDLMENVVEPAHAADGALEVPITPFPIFIRGHAGTLAALCDGIASATLSGAKEFPLAVDLKLTSRTSADLSCTNRISRRFEGLAKIGAKEIKLSIPESGSTSSHVELPKLVPYDSIALLSLPLSVSENGGSDIRKNLSMHAFAVSNAKGWDDVPWMKLTNRKICKTTGGTAAKPVDVKAGYKGDFEAESKLRWDGAKLHLLVKVIDDKAFFPKGENRGGDWVFDSLQVYIDTYGDNASRKTKTTFDFNDYAYTISRDAETGKARVYREAVPEAQLIGGVDALKSNCVDTETEAKVTMTSDGYIYEIAFPTRSIAPLALKSGTFARLGLSVNDNDGERRKQCLVNTDTPDSEPYTHPEQWPGMILTDGQ